MSRVALLNHVYILNILAVFSPFGIELYLRICMPSPSSALYILYESPVKIEPAEIQRKHSVLGASGTYLITKLQSGISRPSSAMEVANCMRQTLMRPVQRNPYKAVELSLPKLHQSDDLLSKRNIDVTNVARVGTDQNTDTKMGGAQPCKKVS